MCLEFKEAEERLYLILWDVFDIELGIIKEMGFFTSGIKCNSGFRMMTLPIINFITSKQNCFFFVYFLGTCDIEV